MSSKAEERSVSAALRQIPQVNNQRAFSATVTISGVGLADITVDDVYLALRAQNDIIDQQNSADQMYIHRMRAYGSGGGYLSVAPYPHRQYLSVNEGATVPWFNCTTTSTGAETSLDDFRKGSLTQMYEFGINGSTRPELSWSWAEQEVTNNPFFIGTTLVPTIESAIAAKSTTQFCKLCTIQSTNTSGDALYIVQFDVTARNSRFIPITQSLGGAAFGERNVTIDNYKPSLDQDKRKEEGKKALELANKKRKIENVKALTMPVLDSH